MVQGVNQVDWLQGRRTRHDPLSPGPSRRTQYMSSSRVWPITGPSLLFIWRQLIPTRTQRLGSFEWPKWQQSSWPRRLRPAEWSSLCPHGHRGLAELSCFLRGHLAGLCSYPSNAGTGISTCFRWRLVVDSRKIACKGSDMRHAALNIEETQILRGWLGRYSFLLFPHLLLAI